MDLDRGVEPGIGPADPGSPTDSHDRDDVINDQAATAAAAQTGPSEAVTDPSVAGGPVPPGASAVAPAVDREYGAPRHLEPVSDTDRDVIARQLGRPPRALRAVAHRCPCGLPTVVQTNPRLDDGTPFPTLYYLTSPRLVALVSTLEASGAMVEMTERLRHDERLANVYLRAHESYLAHRNSIEPLGTDVSAGGMPGRVKCLHVHVAHALAVGPGINPFGDESLERLSGWHRFGHCQ